MEAAVLLAVQPRRGAGRPLNPALFCNRVHAESEGQGLNFVREWDLSATCQPEAAFC